MIKVVLSEPLDTPKMHFSGVYLLYRINELVYVGASSNIGVRLKNHRASLRRDGKMDNYNVGSSYIESEWYVYCVPYSTDELELMERVVAVNMEPTNGVSGKGQASKNGYILFNDFEEVYVYNLKNFCRDNNHSQGAFSNVLNPNHKLKKHHGYHIRLATREEAINSIGTWSLKD